MLTGFVFPQDPIGVPHDASGHLGLGLNLDHRCTVERLDINGNTVTGTPGGYTGIRVRGTWYTSASLAQSPKVAKTRTGLQISGIEYGGPGIRVDETWTLRFTKDSVNWTIDRRYHGSGEIESTAMPAFSFKDMSTWTGAVLGSGGVAWCKLLDAPNATYAVNTGSATFWRRGSGSCLDISAEGDAQSRAMRFTREPSGEFVAATAVTREPLTPKNHQTRFQRNDQQIWAPFRVQDGERSSSTFSLRVKDYSETFGRGDFKGLDTGAITEMVNTIGRIGVIDQARVGTNGWYSGYICLHEPWQARVGTAIDDPNYTRSESEWLDYAQEHGIRKDGMVMSRWFYNSGDAQPGTFDEATGFYEAQWGRLMDSQSSYVWNVAEQFDQSGDLGWVSSHKSSCEAALEYLLRRDSDGNGLVEMDNKLIKQRRSSDWLDIVWASNENAFVNAQLYGALIQWARVEQILGDSGKAARYRLKAAKLKETFNKPIDQGGFWDPKNGWYVYWRDADGSIHGNNLTMEVNLTALADGICDDPNRRKQLIDTIETRMRRESLLVWPACFDSFAPGEGADDQFPKYENGDIFLSWAEYGVKAYASYDPKIALKYVRQLVDQYNKDGLAFQRYLRADGKGAGDDILAGNCNVITGLYRDIYGILPKYNRLLLDPHLTSELNGTKIRYDFRGRPISVDLSMADYRVKHRNLVVRSSKTFGVDFGDNALTYFSGTSDDPTLGLKFGGSASAIIDFSGFDHGKTWSIRSKRSETIAQTFHLDSAGRTYRLVSNGRTLGTVSRANPTIRVRVNANENYAFSLR